MHKKSKALAREIKDGDKTHRRHRCQNGFTEQGKTAIENFASIWSPLIRGGRKAGIIFYKH